LKHNVRSTRPGPGLSPDLTAQEQDPAGGRVKGANGLLPEHQNG